MLAWDAFQAPQFPYDEALRLARVVGVDMDREIIGHLAEKKASNVILWDSGTRAAKGTLGPPDGSRGWIDAIHHAAHAARTRTLQAAGELLERSGAAQEPVFLSALEAVLEVLPPPAPSPASTPPTLSCPPPPTSRSWKTSAGLHSPTGWMRRRNWNSGRRMKREHLEHLRYHQGIPLRQAKAVG